MLQKDYIMRMVEQMAKMLARILFLKEEDKQKEALKEIENASLDTIGIDPVLLDTLPVETIGEVLGIRLDSSLGSMKCIIAGRILKEKAGILSATGRKEADGLYRKALSLYLKGFMNLGYTEIDLTGFREDVGKIEEKLQGSLSDEEKQLLAGFHDTMG